MGLTASAQGLKMIEEARKQRGWQRQDTRWYMAASVSVSVLKRFRAGESVGEEAFINICKAVGIDKWEEIVDDTVQETELPISSSSTDSSARDPNFVGRENAIANLNTLVSQGAKVILIHAKGGVGKTTLARKYLQQQFSSYIEFPIAKETQNITSVESLIEERLRQLGEEPGREFGVSLDRLKRKLQTERIGVLIDNLEPALDGNGKFIEPHRRYVELLSVLADPAVESLTLITSRECLRESVVTVRHYLLEGLDLGAWQEFLNTRHIQTDSLALSAMHRAYGGNAKAMEILSSTTQQDYEGNLEAYWQASQGDLLLERDLEDLVAYQFNRLQQLNPDAYKLLCRMGCYRYQDVPTVPEEGLFCLLWDVPETQHRRVVKALRDRSLVEFSNGEYWLHPVIRAEARERLRKSKDWETLNRTAAEFWTESVKTVETVEDALRALEAYYHYLEVKDFEQAGCVIINRRTNKWGKVENLGMDFWRLGLLQQLIYVINRIIDDIKADYCLGFLNLLLGYSYNLTGKINQALKYHDHSQKIGSKLFKSPPQKTTKDLLFRFRTLEIVSFINIGCCQIDLFEIEEAIENFKKSCLLAENTDWHRYAVDSWYCLAFLNSCLGFEQEAYYFADKAYYELSITQWSVWNQGYALLFLGLTYNNLGEIQKSFEMYDRAISFADETHYTQVNAKAVDGLAQLYRKQGDFKTALLKHSEAIELLDKIGAKCDLAEASYQLGLTYQKMGDAQKSQENFDKAIQLFSEMEAPKQVEKVRRARESGG